MEDNEPQQTLKQIYSKHSQNNKLSLEQTLAAFSELKYKPSKKDYESIFNTLKSRSTDYLTFEQFEFWWEQLRSIQTQSYLVKLYVKLWKFKAKIKEKLDANQLNEGSLQDACSGNLIRIAVGNTEKQDLDKLTKLSFTFKNSIQNSNNDNTNQKEKSSIRQELEISDKELAFVIEIKLSEGIDKEQCVKTLQQLIKSIIVVGTSFHKGTKEILSKITFTARALDGNAYIIAKFEKNLMQMLVTGIGMVQDYLAKLQPEEEFNLTITKQNDLLEILEGLRSKDPAIQFPSLFNNLEIHLSTLACRFLQLMEKCKDLEELNTPEFQLAFAGLLMLRSIKFDLQLQNFGKEDQWVYQQYASMLPQFNSNQKIPLPNMNIIKKIKDFCFAYLESFAKIYLFGPNMKIKTEMRLPKLSSVLLQTLEF